MTTQWWVHLKSISAIQLLEFKDVILKDTIFLFVCSLELSFYVSCFNPFASGIQKVLLYLITGLFSVKILKKFIVIKNVSVNDTMSGQPNKRLIHWHFEN